MSALNIPLEIAIEFILELVWRLFNANRFGKNCGVSMPANACALVPGRSHVLAGDEPGAPPAGGQGTACERGTPVAAFRF